LKQDNKTLLNEQISKITNEVRCIGDDGTQYGIISIEDAIDKAYNMGLDVVMVSNGGTPPVVKIMDYSKFKYQTEKKKKEARKKQKQIDIKEIKLTPKIAQNDINYKVKHAINFLEAGKHVRFKVFLRGREISTPELSYGLLERVVHMIEHVGDVEKPPTAEGRHVTMYIVPTKDKSKKEVKSDAKDENL
jgi:translation initiation factor IF-3